MNPHYSPEQPTVEERCYLIDRESNLCQVVHLPEENAWGPVSVSPWSDSEGHTDAVGPCYSLPLSEGGTQFWGLARFQFPEGRIIEKVHLDVLPTSRPCWSPERPGRILFAAGDGKLYWMDFQDEGDDGLGGTPSSRDARFAIPQAVQWNCSPLMTRSLIIADPTWPGDARLRHLLFATGTPQVSREERTSTHVPQIWWFMLSHDGTTIEAAGQMEQPADVATESTVQRFPTIGVDRRGKTHLFYLARTRGNRALRLEAVPIEIDGANRQPRVVAGSRPVVLESDAALTPPLVAADGLSVIGVTRGSGQLKRYRIDEKLELQGRIALAGGASVGGDRPTDLQDQRN
jgi:hypothetical protein